MGLFHSILLLSSKNKAKKIVVCVFKTLKSVNRLWYNGARMKWHRNEIETQATICVLRRELSRNQRGRQQTTKRRISKEKHAHNTLGREKDVNQLIKLFGRIWNRAWSAVGCWVCVDVAVVVVVVESFLLAFGHIHRHSVFANAATHWYHFDVGYSGYFCRCCSSNCGFVCVHFQNCCLIWVLCVSLNTLPSTKTAISSAPTANTENSWDRIIITCVPVCVVYLDFVDNSVSTPKELSIECLNIARAYAYVCVWIRVQRNKET